MRVDIHYSLEKNEPNQHKFADFLIYNHDKTWFGDSLFMCAEFAKRHALTDLLPYSLTCMQLHEKATYERVIGTLLYSDANASLMLYYFLSAKENDSIQALGRSPAINQFIEHIGRAQLLNLIRILNSQDDWQQNALYRFVLMRFAINPYPLFSSTYSDDSERQDELNQLAMFIFRHLQTALNPDNELMIGYKLLSELVINSAKIGHTGLFYANGMLKPEIAAHPLTRSRWTALFNLQEDIWARIKKSLLSLRGWITKDVKEKNERLTDKKRALDAWALTKENQLPLIALYLLHYVGDADTLTQLITDYFTSLTINSTSIYPLVTMLTQYPELDISALIFSVLIRLYDKTPQLFDLKILHSFAIFHYSYHLKQPFISPQAELAFIHYLGQHKYYNLIEKSCLLLAPCQSGWSLNDKKALNQFQLEAHVEKELIPHQNKAYFGILSSLKRWWGGSLSQTQFVSGFGDKSTDTGQVKNWIANDFVQHSTLNPIRFFKTKKEANKDLPPVHAPQINP